MKAFPDDAVNTKRASGVDSSFDRCRVLETRDKIDEYERGSTSIQVGRDRLLNMDRTRSTISLFSKVERAETEQ